MENQPDPENAHVQNTSVPDFEVLDSLNQPDEPDFKPTPLWSKGLIVLSLVIPLVVIVAIGSFIYSNPSVIGLGVLESKPVSVGPLPVSIEQSEDEILAEAGAPETLKVVYSSNPNLNCGYKFLKEKYGDDAKTYQADAQNWVAGCFRNEHPDTLFVYWGNKTSFDDRKYTLLHEYGHYRQSLDSGTALETVSSKKVEQDADCRAYSYGASEKSGDGCQIDNWTPDWLAQQVKK